MRALERDPARRFATAREFAIALEHAGAVALDREVGEWVAEIGGAALAERAERVAEIESVSTAAAPFGATAAELAAHRRSLGDDDAAFASGGSSPSAIPSASASQPSMPSWSGQSPAAQAEGTSPSQVTNLSLASSPDLAQAAPRRRQALYAALLGVAGALALALVVVVVALVRRSSAGTSASSAATPAASAPEAAVAPRASEDTEPPVASAKVAPSASAATAPSASAPPRPRASAKPEPFATKPATHPAARQPTYHAPAKAAPTSQGRPEGKLQSALYNRRQGHQAYQARVPVSEAGTPPAAWNGRAHCRQFRRSRARLARCPPDG